MQNIHIETLKSVRQMLDTLKFQTVLKNEKALNPLRLKASEMAPPVGLESTTLSVRNIVALLAWGARNAPCFFLLGAPLHLPQAARCSEPVNSGCDANIKQYHSIPCSVEP